MAASRKVQVILTKYFMCINRGHYVIYPQIMKFERLILWPGGVYTDAMHILIHESWLHRLIGKYPKWAKNSQPSKTKGWWNKFPGLWRVGKMFLKWATGSSIKFQVAYGHTFPAKCQKMWIIFSLVWWLISWIWSKLELTHHTSISYYLKKLLIFTVW